MDVGEKIRTIMHEGVRRNTHKPVSKSNPRQPVDINRAVAIAMAMKREGRI